jgi:hypothetical protein
MVNRNLRYNATLGALAQLVEQLTLNQWVVGSSPTCPTINIKGLNCFRFNPFLLELHRGYSVINNTDVKAQKSRMVSGLPDFFVVSTIAPLFLRKIFSGILLEKSFAFMSLC